MKGGKSDREVHERLARAAAAEPLVGAPEGFLDRVMGAVYRESLRGASLEPPEVALRVRRRIGLSFVLSAAVVAAALLAPAGLLPGALRPDGVSAAMGAEQPLVKRALVGADALVRGALRPAEGGAVR